LRGPLGVEFPLVLVFELENRCPASPKKRKDFGGFLAEGSIFLRIGGALPSTPGNNPRSSDPTLLGAMLWLVLGCSRASQATPRRTRKAYLLFGDRDFLQMWQTTVAAVNQYLPDIVRNGELWYGHADMNTGKRTATIYGALDAFFPGLLVLSGDFGRATRLQESSFKMWNLYGIEPELIDYSNLTVVSPPYILRPEIVESAFYLHYFTHQPGYLSMGETFFNALVNYCRVEAGYTRLTDVTTKAKDDQQDSFLLAEDFKYYYLLFSPVPVLNLDRVVFNTEAHPLLRLQAASH
jgi:hypothetical protein